MAVENPRVTGCGSSTYRKPIVVDDLSVACGGMSPVDGRCRWHGARPMRPRRPFLTPFDDPSPVTHGLSTTRVAWRTGHEAGFYSVCTHRIIRRSNRRRRLDGVFEPLDRLREVTLRLQLDVH